MSGFFSFHLERIAKEIDGEGNGGEIYGFPDLGIAEMSRGTQTWIYIQTTIEILGQLIRKKGAIKAGNGERQGVVNYLRSVQTTQPTHCCDLPRS